MKSDLNKAQKFRHFGLNRPRNLKYFGNIIAISVYVEKI
jgi:hypothetical protein